MFPKKLPSFFRSWRKLTPAVRRLSPLLQGPHCALFLLSFAMAMLVGLLFVWSIHAIMGEGELMLFYIPPLCALFTWYAIIKEPIIVVALYHRTLWQLLKKRLVPYHVARLDPNEAGMRQRLISLTQAGYGLGLLLSLLSI